MTPSAWAEHAWKPSTLGKRLSGYGLDMTEPMPEPEPIEPFEPETPGTPQKQPDLPDPAFPEVLPGGDDAPGTPSEE